MDERATSTDLGGERPLEAQSYGLSGLDNEVEILIDSHGIAHIYASNEHDLFFAQGFNAARDRLFQLDLWRRSGRGLLSEVFGPEHLERDRAARLFSYRGDPEADFAEYAPDAKAIVTAFCEGINAYIDLTEDDPSLLSFEFDLLGYRPGRYVAEDITRNRTNMGAGNVSEEVARARTLAGFGEVVEDLRRDRDPHLRVTIPDGLELDSIPKDVLRIFEVLRSPIRFKKKELSASAQPPDGANDGSNNWAVAPSKSATGRAILASDPHRGITLPSLRYLVHLVAPTLDVIGGGEPALPGISVGHNGKVAFGFTVFSTDQEDLYCYETDPKDPRRYRYKDGFEAMRVVTEKVPVAGGDAVGVELVFTRHGPVIYEDTENHRAYAVRSACLEPGAAPYLASLRQLRVRDVHELLASLDHWACPGENFVCADSDGNIAYKPAALIPRRPNWDGLLPVPGDGRYEWDGFYSRDDYPATINPPAGFLATANSNEIPKDFQPERNLGFEWAGPYRKHRIEEVIANSAPMTIDEHAALQVDHVSLPARLVVEITNSLPRPTGTPLEAAYDLMANFDANVEDGPGAALFEIWYRKYLRRALLRRELEEAIGETLAAEALEGPLAEGPFAFGKTTPVHEGVLRRALVRLSDGDKELIDLVLDTLGQAVSDLGETLGAQMDTWSWTAMHRSVLRHPLSLLVDEHERGQLDLGPIPRKGDGDTVGCTTSGQNHVQFHGADFRVVIDVGEFDASVAMNSPGQSADPRSAHYNDLYEAWGQDQTIPLPYSRRAVEQITTARLLLSPSSR